MTGRVRLFVWRHRKGLAVAYLGLVATAWAGFLVFTYRTPNHIDIAVAVALRARAYHASFQEVERAEHEIEQGRLDVARRRLEKFLDAHEVVQRSQLDTHAVVRGTEVLSDLYLRQNRTGKAVRLLRRLTDRLPVHYRAWYLLGLAEKSAGDLSAAAESLGAAFRLTLNHPEVTETYLGVLADLTRYRQVVWVADQFEHAGRRALPTARVKVGRPRGSLQARGLDWAGIPIEHGTFFRSFESRGLPRGEHGRIVCPPELFRSWPSSQPKVTIQVRFEHVYAGLRVKGLRRLGGSRESDVVLKRGEVRYLHQAHSSREAYAEFEVPLASVRGQEIEILYSCPEHFLSTQSLAIIEKARANTKPRGS